MFSYLLVPFAFALGVAPLLRWKQNKFNALKNKLLLIGLLSIVITASWLYSSYDVVSSMTFIAVLLAVWVTISTIFDVVERATKQTSLIVGLKQFTNSYWAMVSGHFGFACVVMSVALTSAYSVERDVRMMPGETVTLNEYVYRFDGIKEIVGANYTGHAAMVSIHKEGEKVTKLYAEKRLYNVGMQFMTEAAIDASLGRDLYVALGEQLNNGAWALRIYHKPYIRWMWLGGLIMSFAGLLILLDKRYRGTSKVPQKHKDSNNASQPVASGEVS